MSNAPKTIHWCQPCDNLIEPQWMTWTPNHQYKCLQCAGKANIPKYLKDYA